MKKIFYSLVFFSMMGYSHQSDACEGGGVGATSCSVSTSVGFLGLGGTRTVSTTCGAGYYACCGTRTATCVENPPSPPAPKREQ